MKLRFAVPAIAATFVMLTPSAASAAALTRYDNQQDVSKLVSDPNTGDPVSNEVVPTRTLGDIKSTRVSFSADTVRVSASFRALAKVGGTHVHIIRLVTTKLERNVTVVAQSGMWAGGSLLVTKSGKPLECKGLTHALDYTNKRVIVNVPRSCLGNPGAVRMGFGTAIMASDTVTYLDDALKKGPSNDEDLTLGPKVFRTTS